MSEFNCLSDDDLVAVARRIETEKRKAWNLFIEIDNEWARAMTVIRERELTVEYAENKVSEAS